MLTKVGAHSGPAIYIGGNKESLFDFQGKEIPQGKKYGLR